MKNFYLKYKSPVAVLLFIILLGGIYILINIQSGLLPDVTFPKIKIIAENGEQPVDKMMVSVTVPLENTIKRVPDLNLLRSTTSRGSSEISAFFNWGSDINLAQQQVESRISEIKETLPADVSISVEKMNPSIFPIIGFSLEGKGFSQIELKNAAEYRIKPFLSRIEGISEVEVQGGEVQEYHIIMDAQKLGRLKISPQVIATAVSQSNFISSTGYLNSYDRLYLTLAESTQKNKNDIENLVISNNRKRVIRLKDAARIEIGSERQYINIKANGQVVPLIMVLKQPDANLIDIENAIKKELPDLQRILPKGMNLRIFYDQADFVADAIGSLRDVMWIGLLLAILMTVLFLKSLKASSVILVTIPLTLGLTFIALYLFHYTVNIMTIGAIAASIGLIIDDAIVVVEQIHRTHEENPEETSTTLVIKAIRYLFPAMVGSSLSTIVIFFPFFLMGGVAGAYFKVLTNTMIITLVCSFFVTWIILPVIYLLFSKKESALKQHKEVKKRNWVYFFIFKPVLSFIFVIILIAASFFIIPSLQSGFLPDMDEGLIILDYKSPPGTSLAETDRMLNVVDDIIKNTSEVESFSRRIGTELGFFITEPNTGDYTIQLKKERNLTTEEVSDKIRKQIEAKLPALEVDFGQMIEDVIGDLISSKQPIEIKIFGDEQSTLQNLAMKVAGVVESVQGTADVFDGITIAGPSIVFKPKYETLAQYGLTPSDLQSQMNSKIKGEVVGNVLNQNQLINIRMFNGKLYNTLNDLRNGFIFLNDGTAKPLKEFTDVHLENGAAEITRENLKQMINVSARLNNRDLGSTLKEIQNKINSEIKLPGGYEIVYGGSYAEQQQAFNDLMIILILAILLVFTVILFLFRKINIAIAIILIAVLGISGSLIALFITGTPLNVGSYTGIIMIVGIIGENSIFTYLQYREFKRADNSKEDSIVYSISTRLRPKLMTAFGAIIALLPLAFGIGTGAQMHQPLAIAIIGGFIIALPLLLVVLPTILRIIEK
ncbi:MAG TPA: efflux RND transporter permease subunit [Ignavibacteriaceae bacterium]|nr:efflux RND transporter permease subunit [Ignavibacteriaceae bacterium]